MQSRIDFLSTVLPPTGNYCLVALKKDMKPKQTFVSSLDDIAVQAEDMVTKGYDAYFALGTFSNVAEGRLASNADEFKSFFLDIDCGAGKPYATQVDGFNALKKFIKTTGLPRPTVVNSGRGLHAYWGLFTPIPKDEWKELAEGLKALCVQNELETDTTVTADAARILRIPDTLNFKDSPPLPVVITSFGGMHELDKLSPIFNAASLLVPDKKYLRQLDPTTLALMGNYQSRFKNILLKSEKGSGCQQLLDIFTNQESVSEPLWRAGLSIAYRCVDGDKAIHKISDKYSGYNYEVTVDKAQQTKGPYTCSKFREINPSGCAGCTQKITSPIQLGKEVVEALEEVATIREIEDVTKEIRTYEIPKFPFPFFRGKVGGVYRKGNPNIEGDEDALLFPYDLYVVRRINDPDDGDSVWLRLHLPKDGVRDFIIPARDVVAKDRFRDAIANKGILINNNKQLDMLMSYIIRWNEELQATTKADKARKQFGWLEDNSAFIIGDREIQPDAVVYSPPTAPTLPIIPAFQTKGSFHVWKDVINAYGRPGMEDRAFAFFMGFGGPLLKFVADGTLSGFLLNLVSQQSGSGKTTILYAINSIYGMPQPLLLSSKDTHNHRMQRLGVMQSLTPTIDEITNMPPDQMSNLVYDITSGQGKNRMSGKANVERTNNINWKIPVVTSSNKFIKDALLTIKAYPEAELLRTLEIKILPDAEKFDDPIWSKAHFGKLMHNYGHAIEPYIKYCMNNLPEVITFVNEVNTKLDRAAKITQSERYWSAGATIGLAGGLLASKVSLHDIPTEPVFDFAVKLIQDTRKNNKDVMFEGSDVVNGFVQRRLREMLVINGNLDKRTGLETGPIREPYGPLTMRYEPDTKMLFIVVRTFREDCAKMSISYEQALDPYVKNGALVEPNKLKRMTAGTVTNADSGVRALWFDTTKMDLFKEQDVINAPNIGPPNTDRLG